jgi:hypothetical protein
MQPKRTAALLVLITLVVAPGVWAQTSLVGHIGVGYPVYTDDNNSNVYDTWPFHIDAGLMLEYQPIAHLIIGPRFSYQYLFFNEYHQYTVGNDYIVNQSGNASQVYQLGVDLMFHGSRENLIDPQLILGGGYQWTDFGSIRATWSDLNGTLRDEGFDIPSSNNWYVTFGFAAALRISDVLFLNCAITSMNGIDYYNSYDSSDWIVSAAINYRII